MSMTTLVTKLKQLWRLLTRPEADDLYAAAQVLIAGIKPEHEDEPAEGYRRQIYTIPGFCIMTTDVRGIMHRLNCSPFRTITIRRTFDGETLFSGSNDDLKSIRSLEHHDGTWADELVRRARAQLREETRVRAAAYQLNHLALISKDDAE